MATQPRGWPDNAKTARDQSAYRAAEVVRALGPILDEYHEMSSEEVIARAGKAMVAAQTILRLLERQGAPTIPDEL